jgi:hypothetical protein
LFALCYDALVKRIALAVCLTVTIFTTTTRVPASVCPVASAPIGEVCQMGCCANKCCCTLATRSEPAPVPAAKQDEPALQWIGDIAVSANFIAAPIAIESGFDIAPAHVVISRTRPALLCTFLI